MAETFVNLVTGATLPDQGTVSSVGRPTVCHQRQHGLAGGRRSLRHRQRACGPAASAFGDAESVDAVHARDRSAARRHSRARRRSWRARSGSQEARLAPSGRRPRRRPATCASALQGAGTRSRGPPARTRQRRASARRVATIGSRIRQIASRRGLALLAVARRRRVCAAVAARVLRLDQATGRLVERRRNWSFFRGGG